MSIIYQKTNYENYENNKIKFILKNDKNETKNENKISSSNILIIFLYFF